jgi:NAD(P)H-hydrate epimerase
MSRLPHENPNRKSDTAAAGQDMTAGRIVSVREMQRTEQAAFAAGLDSFVAMERAGRAVAEAILARWRRRPVLVLCGPGNNGGDGYIIATALRAAGWPVTVAALAAPASADARRAAAGWANAVLAPDDIAWPDASGLIIDALFGIGLARKLDGAAAGLVQQANQSGAPIVSVDIPSGIQADSGAILGTAMAATLTVTFAWRKPGHLLLPGRTAAGDVVVADIGLPAAPLPDATAPVWQNAPALWRASLPVPGVEDHKYSRGHLLAVGGGVMTGAVRLAVRAARRGGAGLATILAPVEAVPVYALDQAGAIVRPRHTPDDVGSFLQDSRVTAVLIGSGLEPGGETPALLRQVLTSGRPAVIDGGGLDAWRDLDRAGAALPVARRGPVVLTPHEGEFARLCGDLGEDLGSGQGKLQRARAAARLFDAVIVLKGADTVIASPDGRAIINGGAPAYLATAGSGDVLAGLIAGLLAQRMDPFAASAAAVWLHGEAARFVGLGLLAEDLPDLLPRARKNL